MLLMMMTTPKTKNDDFDGDVDDDDDDEDGEYDYNSDLLTSCCEHRFTVWLSAEMTESVQSKHV